MTTKNVKQALLTSIHTLNDYKWLFLRDPQKDHTRSRKLPFEKTISAVECCTAFYIDVNTLFYRRINRYIACNIHFSSFCVCQG